MPLPDHDTSTWDALVTGAVALCSGAIGALGTAFSSGRRFGEIKTLLGTLKENQEEMKRAFGKLEDRFNAHIDRDAK